MTAQNKPFYVLLVLLVVFAAFATLACDDDGSDPDNPLTDPNNPIQQIRRLFDQNTEQSPCVYRPDSTACKVWKQTH